MANNENDMTVAYIVSKFMDTIKRVEDFDRFKEKTFRWNDFYSGHDSYDDAKKYIINRAELKIVKLESEIKKIKKKLPKLREMHEKLNSEPNDERSVAMEVDSKENDDKTNKT